MAKRTGLDSLSLSDLQREIKRRERKRSTAVNKLVRKRDRLAEQLAALDAEIAKHGGSTRGGARRRPRNEGNLAEFLEKVLKGQTMSVTEAAAAVQKAGYVTTSPNFRTIVNQMLLKGNLFKRVGRGQYTAKG
jgi:CTP-dependent riboflavin kinase